MSLILLFLATIIILSLILNKKIKKSRFKRRDQKFNSLAKYFSYCFILWSLLATIIISITPLTIYIKIITITLFYALGFFLLKNLQQKNFNAKKHIEKSGEVVLSITAGIGILITIIITASIFF